MKKIKTNIIGETAPNMINIPTRPIKNPKYMEEFEKIRGFDKNKIDRILGI